MKLKVGTKDCIEKLLDEDELLQLTKKVVAHYAYIIPDRDREDVRMSLVEDFLKQEEKITRQFQGKSKKSTYCYAVLNRMCYSIIRRDIRHWKTLSDNWEQKENHLNTDKESTTYSLLINDEINHLKRLLIINNDNNKTTIFLAYYYQLIYKIKFLKVYDPNYKSHQLTKLLMPEQKSSKGKIYQILAQVVNAVETKQIKSDAVRIWLNKQREVLINRLNGPFERASYTKETFCTLFELYYDKE